MKSTVRASDRMTTLEELLQVMDLLQRVPAHQEPAGSFILEFSLPLLEREGPADSKGLWIDMSEEDARVHPPDACPDSLPELFADRSDLAN